MAQTSLPNQPVDAGTVEFTPSEEALGLTDNRPSDIVEENTNHNLAASTILARENTVATGGVITAAPSRILKVGDDGARLGNLSKETNVLMKIDHVDNVYFRDGQHAEVKNIQTFKADMASASASTLDNRPVPAIVLSTGEGPPESLELSENTCGMTSFVTTSSTHRITDTVVDYPMQESFSTIVRDHADYVKVMDTNVQNGYKDVIRLVNKSFAQSKSPDVLPLYYQQLIFTQTNGCLMKSFVDGSFDYNVTADDFKIMYDALYSLNEQLKRAISQFSEVRSMKPAPSRPVDLTNWFMEWFSTLERVFTVYVTSAQGLSPPIYGRSSYRTSAIDIKTELRKLSNEGKASSQLKHYLCQACPKQCHTNHTAYFSLEPDKSTATLDKEKDETKPQEPDGTWKCHMAFKSTIASEDNLIWLRVVSTIVVDVPKSSPLALSHGVEEHASPSKSLTRDPLNTEPIKSNTRKRRASSTPVEVPEPKAQKTSWIHQAARHLSNTGLGIEVCPGYFAPHNPTPYAIMKMVDSSGCDHRIFYLPKEKRSAYGAARPDGVVRLRTVLDQRYHEKFDTLWILRLSRLVAEAVVRFDLRDSDRSPEDSVVFYDLRTAKEPAPFLEVNIKKPGFIGIGGTEVAGDRSNGHEEQENKEMDDDADLGRRHTLLNLGLILLKLGLERGKEPTQMPMGGVEGQQRYIIKRATDARIGSPKFPEVIKNCARFFTDNRSKNEEDRHQNNNGGGSGIIYNDDNDDQLFRESFYQKIVQPLKEMEAQLLSQQEKGKRWTRNGNGTGDDEHRVSG